MHGNYHPKMYIYIWIFIEHSGRNFPGRVRRLTSDTISDWQLFLLANEITQHIPASGHIRWRYGSLFVATQSGINLTVPSKKQEILHYLCIMELYCAMNGGSLERPTLEVPWLSGLKRWVKTQPSTEKTPTSELGDLPGQRTIVEVRLSFGRRLIHSIVSYDI